MKDNSHGTLLLDRRQISGLAGFRDYFRAVENAFRAHGNGQALAQGLLHLDAEGGEFHVKAGGLKLGRPCFAFKINDGFYANARDLGLPNILGTIILCDGATGFPLAILDSSEITIFDSTVTALQDVAAAAMIYEKALAQGAGTSFQFRG